MAIFGSIKERFAQRKMEQADTMPRPGREPRYREESTERPKRFQQWRAERQEKKEERELKASKRAMESSRRYREAKGRYMDAKLQKRASQTEIEAREMERKAKRAQFVAQHPYLEKTGERVSKAGKRIGKFAEQRSKEVATAYGSVTGISYVTGQRIAPQQKRKDTRGAKGEGKRIRTVYSTMAPETQYSQYSLSQGVASMAYRPSMFQSDITQPSPIRGTILEPRTAPDYIGGLGMGLGTKKDYYGSGSKKKTDYGFGSKRTGILQTTKKRQRFY